MNNESKPVAIAADNVHFSYPDGHEALKGVSCEIRRGEKVALIGPNGAGKSTFMGHLNGVQLATSGKLSVNGIEVTKNNLRFRNELLHGVIQRFAFAVVGGQGDSIASTQPGRRKHFYEQASPSSASIIIM